MGKYKWILIALLWVAALLNYLDRQMLATMRVSMQQDIAELESALNFGRLMAVFLWIYGLMSPVSGFIADKFNKKGLIVASLFVWSAVTFLMRFADTFEELYVLRALMGISEAIYMPTSLALIVQYHDSSTRSLAVGLHLTGFYVGQSLGGFGANIAEALSWQDTFGLFGLVGMLYSFVLLLFLKSAPVPEGESKGSTKTSWAMFKSLPFYIVLLYFTLPGIPGWAIKNWLPTLFSENLGIPMTAAGPMATICFSMSSLVGVLIGGTVADRWIKKTLRARQYISALGVFLCIPALLLMSYGESVFVCGLAAVIGGIGFGFFDTNNMPIVCQFISVRSRATAYGMMNMLGVFTGAFATTLLGKYSDENRLGDAFSYLIVLLVVAIVLQLVFLKPKTDDYV